MVLKLYHLKELRIASHLSQDTLAQRIHISRQAYAMYEAGERNPNIETIYNLAEELHVSTDYLLGREKVQPPPPPVLKEDEQILLKYYRQIDQREKTFLRQMIFYACLLCPSKKGKEDLRLKETARRLLWKQLLENSESLEENQP